MNVDNVIYVFCGKNEEEKWSYSFYIKNNVTLDSIEANQDNFKSFYDLYRQVTALISLYINRSSNALFPEEYELEFIREDEEGGKNFIFEGFEYEMSDIFVGQKDYDFDRPIWKELNQ